MNTPPQLVAANGAVTPVENISALKAVVFDLLPLNSGKDKLGLRHQFRLPGYLAGTTAGPARRGGRE